MTRIERVTSPLPRECSTTEPHGHRHGFDDDENPHQTGVDMTFKLPLERETGIEPVSLAWKAKVLPLNYSRPGVFSLSQNHRLIECALPWWRRLDSNQRTRKRADLQSAAFNHSATPPRQARYCSTAFSELKQLSKTLSSLLQPPTLKPLHASDRPVSCLPSVMRTHRAHTRPLSGARPASAEPATIAASLEKHQESRSPTRPDDPTQSAAPHRRTRRRATRRPPHRPTIPIHYQAKPATRPGPAVLRRLHGPLDSGRGNATAGKTRPLKW